MNKPTFKLSYVEKYDYSRKHYNSCWDIQVFLEETTRWIRLYSSFSEYKARLAYEKIKDKYDLYDDVVTKDELYDALEESLETNNSDKLKMLLKQEEVNRLKKEIKEKQEKLNKSSRYDTFDDDDF